MLHHGDAFTWTIPLIAKSMKEMCLNLVEFTNSGPENNLGDEQEDEEFQELMEFVDNELNFTGIFYAFLFWDFVDFLNEIL